MKTYYKNNLKQTQLILEGEEQEAVEYEIFMLRDNEVPGLLKTEVRYLDNQNQYYYDISGKTSLKTCYEKATMSYQEMKGLVLCLLDTVQSVQNYMLDENSILLEPEFIFKDKEIYYFCYYFSNSRDIKQAFHELTEFFVQQVDYKDEEGVRFAYTLHKATMDENYSIEQIMEEFMPEEEMLQLQETEVPEIEYCQHMEVPSLEESMLEEKNNFWKPIKKLIQLVKHGRFGYEEEDL